MSPVRLECYLVVGAAPADLSDTERAKRNSFINGEEGDDQIVGGVGDDVILGGEGNKPVHDPGWPVSGSKW